MIVLELEPELVIPALWISREQWNDGYTVSRLARELDAFPEAARDAGGWLQLVRAARWREPFATLAETKLLEMDRALSEERTLDAAAKRLGIDPSTLYRYRLRVEPEGRKVAGRG